MPTRINQEGKVFTTIIPGMEFTESPGLAEKQAKTRYGQRATLLKDATLYDTVMGSIEQRQFTRGRKPIKPKTGKHKFRIPRKVKP